MLLFFLARLATPNAFNSSTCRTTGNGSHNDHLHLRFEVLVNASHVRHDLLPIRSLELTHFTDVLQKKNCRIYITSIEEYIRNN